MKRKNINSLLNILPATILMITSTIAVSDEINLPDPVVDSDYYDRANNKEDVNCLFIDKKWWPNLD